MRATLRAHPRTHAHKHNHLRPHACTQVAAAGGGGWAAEGVQESK